MKSVRCGDLGFECGYEVEAETEGELLRQVAEHATAVHQITVTPTLIAQVKPLIQEQQSNADVPRTGVRHSAE